MKKKLVVVHVDGVGADSLEEALRDGYMPFTKHLMNAEGYEVHRYRCGVPSTTPFAQAGIIYGDNSEIPSFRWWDRERKVLVQFGAQSTFKKVADKYFLGCDPLTLDGACIAACYPGGGRDDFGIAYQDRTFSKSERSSSAWRVLLPYLANPLHISDWAWQAGAVLVRTIREYTIALSKKEHPARPYVISNALEEIFVHHLTRYAVTMAMRKGFSPIYAGFYAFDETGHAFGPDDDSSLRVLKHVDDTIKKIASARGSDYELVVLSDHGQIATIPFDADKALSFGEILAGLLPGYRVREMKGKTYGPAEDKARGQVNVTASGGLAHVYFADRATRLGQRELAERFPGLATAIANLDKVALVMARDGARDVYFGAGSELNEDAVKDLLAPYDDPDILLAQLSRLNSFAASGDLVVFGSFKDGRQFNFENQAGGHGSIGGEQLHPFVLAKRDWEIDTSQVRGAHELHPILSRLRDRLSAGA